MKTILIFGVTAFLLTGCGGNSQPGDPKDQIAGDKSQLVATLKLADSKGTAGEALAEAAKDSSLREKMEEALGLKKAQPDKHAAAAQPKKDVLDKSSDALDVANEKVTKSGQVIDKAAEVKKKTEDILTKPH